MTERTVSSDVTSDLQVLSQPVYSL